MRVYTFMKRVYHHAWPQKASIQLITASTALDVTYFMGCHEFEDLRRVRRAFAGCFIFHILALPTLNWLNRVEMNIWYTICSHFDGKMDFHRHAEFGSFRYLLNAKIFFNVFHFKCRGLEKFIVVRGSVLELIRYWLSFLFYGLSVRIWRAMKEFQGNNICRYSLFNI